MSHLHVFFFLVPENEVGDSHSNVSHSSNDTSELHQLDVYNTTEHVGHSRRLTRSTEHYPDEEYVHITDLNITSNFSDIHGNDTHHEHHHSNKEIIEHSLHYASLTILSIFVVEVRQ